MTLLCFLQAFSSLFWPPHIIIFDDAEQHEGTFHHLHYHDMKKERRRET